MASNPMQRKSRNSFLLGIIVTLLITGVVIAFLFLQLKQKSDQIKQAEAAKRNVYILAQDVKAGQILTQDMFVLKKIHKDSIPSNATATLEVIESWFLQTKEGENVFTDQYGLYLDRSDASGRAADTIIEVMENKTKEFVDSKGNKVAVGDFYVEANGMTEKVNSLDSVTQDEYGMFFVDTQGNDKITRVYQESATDEFYTYKIDIETQNRTGSKVRIKEYVDIKNVPVLARVDMNKNTVITPQLVVQSNEIVTDDTREEEYNMIVLPLDLMTNDYIDIRLMTPQGQNFIIVSKAQVTIPQNNDGTYVADTLKVDLREDEILAMSSAIVEAYGLPGAKIYVTKYVDPAMQVAALPTYTPNAAVTAQIQSNPNIVEIAKQELATRYSEAAKNARNEYLQNQINSMEYDEYLKNIEKGSKDDIANSITKRKNYLETLEDGANK